MDFSVCEMTKSFWDGYIFKNSFAILWDCESEYKGLTTIKAYFYDEVSIESFQEMLSYHPEKMASWMVKFYDIIDKGDVKSCKSLSDVPELRQYCTIISNRYFPPPKENSSIDVLDDYYFTVALFNGGDKKCMKKVEDPFLHVLNDMMLGHRDACAEYFRSTFCENTVRPKLIGNE